MNIQTIVTVVSEHEGWDWHIEQQLDCYTGVDLVYFEHTRNGKEAKQRICLGSLDDAVQLANAIHRYVTSTKNTVT